MAKIEKINFVKNGEEVEKVLMTINDGDLTEEAEIYLAFVDNKTSKRYIMYTTDAVANENEKITFSLSSFKLQNGEYVLEATEEKDYKEVQLPMINIVGSNIDKSHEEILSLIKEKFGERIVTIDDMQTLKNNVDNIAISDKKKSRKANVPIVIANGIKRFYISRLNKILKEVSKAESMTEEQATVTVEKLDNIEGELDQLTGIYKKHDLTAKIEKSLGQIENAKEDIKQAKRKIEGITVSEEIELPPLSSIEYALEEEGVKIPTPDEVEAAKQQAKEMGMPNFSNNNQQVEQQAQVQTEVPTVEAEPVEKAEETQSSEQANITDNNSEQAELVQNPEQEDLQDQLTVDAQIEVILNEIVETASQKISSSIAAAIKEAVVSVSDMYKEEIENLIIQHANETKSLTASLTQATEQLQQYGDKRTSLESEKVQMEEAKQNLEKENEDLKKQNEELTESLSMKDSQIKQQNDMIESFREEMSKTSNTSQSREQELLAEIESLKIYKREYEKIASIFGGQTFQQPEVKPVTETTTEPQVEQKMYGALTESDLEQIYQEVVAPEAIAQEQSTKTI